MEIDSITKNSASRNLVALSVVIIIYHYTDATLGNPTKGLSTGLLGGTFFIPTSSVDKLKICVFVIHLWLLFKYYLHCNWQEDWNSFYTSMGTSRLITPWVVKRLGEGRWEFDALSTTAARIKDLSFSMTSRTGVQQFVVNDYWQRVQLSLWTFFIESPVLLQYFFPYALFLVSMSLVLQSALYKLGPPC